MTSREGAANALCLNDPANQRLSHLPPPAGFCVVIPQPHPTPDLSLAIMWLSGKSLSGPLHQGSLDPAVLQPCCWAPGTVVLWLGHLPGSGCINLGAGCLNDLVCPVINVGHFCSLVL